eukprot:Gb_18811 [translate_table: standard]
MASTVSPALWFCNTRSNAATSTSSSFFSRRVCNCTLPYNSKPFTLSFNYNHGGKENNQCHVCSCRESYAVQNAKKRQLRVKATNIGQGLGNYSSSKDEDDANKDDKWDYKKYEALIRGGEEVTSVMEEIIELLQDMTKMDEPSEEMAVQIAAQAVVGKRVEKLDESFMMALDFMLGQAENELDDKGVYLASIDMGIWTFGLYGYAAGNVGVTICDGFVLPSTSAIDIRAYIGNRLKAGFPIASPVDNKLPEILPETGGASAWACRPSTSSLLPNHLLAGSDKNHLKTACTWQSDGIVERDHYCNVASPIHHLSVG